MTGAGLMAPLEAKPGKEAEALGQSRPGASDQLKTYTGACEMMPWRLTSSAANLTATT